MEFEQQQWSYARLAFRFLCSVFSCGIRSECGLHAQIYISGTSVEQLESALCVLYSHQEDVIVLPATSKRRRKPSLIPSSALRGHRDIPRCCMSVDARKYHRAADAANQPQALMTTRELGDDLELPPFHGGAPPTLWALFFASCHTRERQRQTFCVVEKVCLVFL